MTYRDDVIAPRSLRRSGSKFKRTSESRKGHEDAPSLSNLKEVLQQCLRAITMAVFQRLRVVYCRFVNRLDIYLFICFVLCFYLDAVRFVRVLFRVNKNKPFQSVLFI